MLHQSNIPLLHCYQPHYFRWMFILPPHPQEYINEADQLDSHQYPLYFIGFNVLFTIPVQSVLTLSIQLALFDLCVLANIWSISVGWDLIFWVDQNPIFGTLQFGTQGRHKKSGRWPFYMGNLISIYLDTNNAIFIFVSYKYTIQFWTVSVSTYMWQVDKGLRQVLSCVPFMFLSISRQGSGQNWPDIQWEKFAPQ